MIYLGEAMKKVIIGLFLIVVTCVMINEKEAILIPDEAIRLRIIANSNEFNDQALKLEVKTEVEKELYNLVSDATNIDDARIIIKNNLEKVDNILKKYDVQYSINYGNNYFPEKNFKGIEYAAGDYESLVITIGSGLGENWWCVLFPPLCLLDEANYSDVEYEFMIHKIINKFK